VIKLSGPMLAPRSNGAPRQAVVLLHGYGSDGNDLITLGQVWGSRFPDAMFVAPHAPDECAANPFGYEWFPLDLDRMQSRLDGARAARPVLVEFLMDLWAQTGLHPAETVLAGFSQGGMMALHVGLSLDRRLAGVVSFSGAFVRPDEGFPQAEAERPPVALVHGDLDAVVDPALSEEAKVVLRAEGYDVSHHVSPGISHSISPDGLDFATAFIARAFSR
jgi:phospholipase/carboxylesterase